MWAHKGTKLPRLSKSIPRFMSPASRGSGPCSTEDNVDQRRIHSGCNLSQTEAQCQYTSEAYLAGVVNSNYNGLQASLRKSMGYGLSFLASYVYSKSLDDNSSFNMTGGSSQDVAGENDLAQNPFNLEAEYGRSLFDQRQRFVFSSEWQLPSMQNGSAWVRQTLGNWQLNGILTLSTGTPFTVYDSTDVSLEGSAEEITGFSSNRPGADFQSQRWSPEPRRNGSISTLSSSSIPLRKPEQFGSAGRNVAQLAGIAQLDFSVFKDFRFTETKTLEFRAEFFNLFNRVSFGLPENDISSPTFGQVESALPPRQVQFALKFLF